MASAKLTPAEVIRKAQNKAKYDANKAVESEAKAFLTARLPNLNFESELHFQPERGDDSCRFDLAILDHRIGIEIEGRGRHTQTWKSKKKDGSKEKLSPFEKDCEKYNDATLRGWRVLRFTYAMIRDGRAAETIRRALE